MKDWNLGAYQRWTCFATSRYRCADRKSVLSMQKIWHSIASGKVEIWAGIIGSCFDSEPATSTDSESEWKESEAEGTGRSFNRRWRLAWCIMILLLCSTQARLALYTIMMGLHWNNSATSASSWRHDDACRCLADLSPNLSASIQEISMPEYSGGDQSLVNFGDIMTYTVKGNKELNDRYRCMGVDADNPGAHHNCKYIEGGPL